MMFTFGERTVPIDLVIFDKDGTLVDLHAPWGRWAEGIAERLATYVTPNDLLRRIGWDQATGRIRPETPLAIASVDEMRAVLAMVLHDHGLGWTASVAAVREAIHATPIVAAPAVCPLVTLFEHLRANGVTIAVVTTDDQEGITRDLEPLGVLSSVAVRIGGDDGIPLKPAPDTVLEVLQRTGISADRTTVVGDSLSDIGMGRAAGVALTVGVLSGSGTHDILAPHADLVVPTVCSLLGYAVGNRG